jgi:LAO/AO transport system kinase
MYTNQWQLLLQALMGGDIQSLSRCISLVENQVPGYEDLLFNLPTSNQPIVGITGAPGAGKSTLTDGLIEELIKHNKRVAILCVDPSSPFNRGALLGDRLRMSAWYNHPSVYIRSVASRGALGGLSPTVIEVTDVMKAAPFDYILIETVGVGQNEVEIAALADTTIVVYVPEAGDEVQTMKAGLTEIADIFVVNKADRPGAQQFAHNLQTLVAHQQKKISVIKTIATEKEGVSLLFDEILRKEQVTGKQENKIKLLADRAYQLIQRSRMKDITRKILEEAIQAQYSNSHFNIYRFAALYADR